MKFVLCVLSVSMFAAVANADVLFYCLDPNNEVAATALLPETGTKTSQVEQSCNGGVGDPTTCDDTVHEIERRTVTISFRLPKTASTQFDVERNTWGGVEIGPFENFKGEGVIALEFPYRVYFESAFQVAGQYNLFLMINDTFIRKLTCTPDQTQLVF